MLSGGEKLLRGFLKRCFKDLDAEFNCRNLGIINPETGAQLEIDIYFREIKLGFEFHGLQHRTVKEQAERDKVKRKKCKELGITLIEVWTSTLAKKDFYEYIYSNLEDSHKHFIKKPKRDYQIWFLEQSSAYYKNIRKFNSRLDDKTKFEKKGRKKTWKTSLL